MGGGGDLGAASAALAAQAQNAPDYATLGSGWDHPESRVVYRGRTHRSVTHPSSAARQARSKERWAALAAGGAELAAVASALLEEVGSADAAAAEGATAEGIEAIADAELLAPLRALHEGALSHTMGGSPVPEGELRAVVRDMTRAVFAGEYKSWKYGGRGNAKGAAQLAGLTPAQLKEWTDGGAEPEEAPGGIFTLETDSLDSFFWATKIGGPSHGFDFETPCVLPITANARHKAVLVDDPRNFPHHPSGRAHLRLLHDAEGGGPLLYLEATNVDFMHGRADRRAFGSAVLAHVARKAQRMGVPLSAEAHLESELAGLARQLGGSVRRAQQRLVLRPSAAVMEASDTLTNLHDWVQKEEMTTGRLTRAVYTP